MSKGRFQKKKARRGINVWLLAVLVIALAALIAVAWFLGQSQGNREDSGGETTAATTGAETQATTLPIVIEDITQPPVEIITQAKADYERWLAASMLIGISMEYPDFEITGIYIASETSLENKADSQGCYILFNGFGEPMAVYSAPLTAERTDAGTRDISSQTLGFATFDTVEPDSVDTVSLIPVEMAELEELIEQSLLVSVWTH